jgi:hypothetical protein
VSRNVLALSFLVATSPTFAADAFIACGIIDPEFQDGLEIVTYQQVVDNSGTLVQQARVQWVKSNGFLYAGTDSGVVATDLSDYLDPKAGPKWSNGGTPSAHESYIVYSRRTGTNSRNYRRTIGALRYDGTQCSYPTGSGAASPAGCFAATTTVPDDTPPVDEMRVIAYSTEEEIYNLPAMVVYHHREGYPTVTHELRWAELSAWFDPPGDEIVGIDDAADEEWGRMQRYHNAAPASPDLWVAAIHGSDPGETILVKVDDPGHVQTVASDDMPRFTPFLYYDPDAGTNMVVVRADVMSGNAAVSSNVELWQESYPGSEDWGTAPALVITSDDLTYAGSSETSSGRPFLLSPEAFIANGHAYLVFSSSNNLYVASATDGNIWIVKASDPVNHQTKPNSRPAGHATRSRVEAEVYFGSHTLNALGPVVYYSQPAEGASYDCDPAVPGRFDVRNYTLRRATFTLP